MIKRILCCLLLLSLLPLSAFSETEEGLYTVSFAIPSAWGGQYAQLPLLDRWFRQDPDQYHHGLARISLAMAVSAFRSSAGREDASIRHFFTQLALEDAQTWDYPAPGKDTIGTAIAWRYLTGLDAPVPLIAVAVCGGNYGDEWANNLHFGLEGDHAGFDAAAEKVLSRLEQFRRAHQLSDQPCIYWLAGFGRGGAVCNVAAARLADSVRCYTFACPGTALDPKESAGVFNLIAAADPLALLPPGAWGFARNGRDLYLPTSLDQRHDYAALLAGYAQVFRQFSGRDDAVGDTALAPMARAAALQLTEAFGSRAAYRRDWEDLLYGVLTGGRLSAGEMLRAHALLRRAAGAAQNAQRGPLPPVPSATGWLAAFASPEIAALWAQHDPAVYFSWMLSLTDETVLPSVSFPESGP